MPFVWCFFLISGHEFIDEDMIEPDFGQVECVLKPESTVSTQLTDVYLSKLSNEADISETTVGVDTKNLGPKCIVSGCESNYVVRKNYPLPESQEIKMKWLQILGRTHFDESNLASERICYKHFHDHDFTLNYKPSKSYTKRRRALKPRAIPSLHLFKNEQYAEIIPTDLKPKQDGWWTCTSCSSHNMFLYFFELIAHCREIHGLKTLQPKLRHKYDVITVDDFIQREINLAKDGWICYMCENWGKFEHKFQLVTHWHENHSIKDFTYEACQWCSELFASPECSAEVNIFFCHQFCFLRSRLSSTGFIDLK